MVESPTVPQATCEHPLRWVNDPTSFGPLAVTCGQSVGVRTWRDSRGETHHACHLHVEARMHRYPPLETAHERHVRTGIADEDCASCERAWEAHALGSGL